MEIRETLISEEQERRLIEKILREEQEDREVWLGWRGVVRVENRSVVSEMYVFCIRLYQMDALKRSKRIAKQHLGGMSLYGWV